MDKEYIISREARPNDASGKLHLGLRWRPDQIYRNVSKKNPFVFPAYCDGVRSACPGAGR